MLKSADLSSMLNSNMFVSQNKFCGLSKLAGFNYSVDFVRILSGFCPDSIRLHLLTLYFFVRISQLVLCTSASAYSFE